MDRIPILKLRNLLLVTIQVDMHDRLAMQLQDELTARISETGTRGVLIDISSLDIVDSFIGRMIANIAATPEPEPTVVVARVTSHHKKSANHPAAAVAKESHHHTRSSHSKVARAQVRRGRKVPTLRVGSHTAELVGTTSDGRWILSVASSGERLIVPPPPGYSR